MPIILGVVPVPMVAWKPESAPQAMVMKMNGITGPPTMGPPPLVNSVNAGMLKSGMTNMMPRASAPMVPIFRKVDR